MAGRVAWPIEDQECGANLGQGVLNEAIKVRPSYTDVWTI
jgi:hypothetical protein